MVNPNTCYKIPRAPGSPMGPEMKCTRCGLVVGKYEAVVSIGHLPCQMQLTEPIIAKVPFMDTPEATRPQESDVIALTFVQRKEWEEMKENVRASRRFGLLALWWSVGSLLIVISVALNIS
jgi:hypothetical protein